MNISRYFKFLNKYYPLLFTIGFIVLITQYSFTSIESIFYDLRVRLDFTSQETKDIVLITLDEESDEFLGEIYPYTYANHRNLLTNIIKDSPAVIGYFVELNEAENMQESRDLIEVKNVIKNYMNNGGAFRFASTMDGLGEQLPPERLKEVGYSLALLNQDSSIFARDDVSRRAILNISGDDSIHLFIANKYRKFKKQSVLKPTQIWGSYYLKEADATFSLYRFASSPVEGRNNFIKIPFHKVAVGNMPDGFFKDKLVIVGSQYISNYDDYILSPFNKETFRAPKINMHALIVNALVNEDTVMSMPRWVTNFIAILLSFFLSFIVFRVNPTKGLFITVLTMFVIVFIAFVFFMLFGVWVYLVHLILSVFIVYYICVPFRAIQEYQRRYAFQEEAKLLKQVDNLKQNFISLMSHDLKTPVARIAGIADILQNQHRLNVDQKKLVSNISESTTELNSFISSILDLTKIESRKISLTMESKDINRIVDGIIQRLGFDASRKNIQIESELGPLYPIKVDTKLMDRVFSNLIENAIKYSGEGSQVSVKTWDDEQWVYVEIKDNGVGIDEENLEHIFDKFYRVKNDTSHKVKGSGLGLYLVKYFIELHKGSISASSIVGEGTTFVVQLRNE